MTLLPNPVRRVLDEHAALVGREAARREAWAMPFVLAGAAICALGFAVATGG